VSPLILEVHEFLCENRHRLQEARVITQSYGAERLHARVSQGQTTAKTKTNTHTTSPASMSVSTSSGASSPFSPRARSTFVLMKRALAANSLPTQMRRPNPNVACPAWFISAGPVNGQHYSLLIQVSLWPKFICVVAKYRAAVVAVPGVWYTYSAPRNEHALYQSSSIVM